MAKLEPGQREVWVLAPFEDEHGNKFPMMVHATELGSKAAQRPGEPDPVRYVPAVEQACAVPAATQDDSWKETAEQWRRAALAWQEWAAPLCQGHPDGGLAGDGPMRDELTARLREAGKAQADWVAVSRLHEFVAFLDEEHAKSSSSATQSAGSIGYQNGLYVASLNLKALLPPPPSAPEGT